MNNLGTEEILKNLKNKDSKGLKILYKNYSAALFGVILKIVDDQEVAEELLQNTFIKIWKNIEKFDDTKGTLFTWMARIARNSALDKVRLKSFQQRKTSETFDVNVHNSESINFNGDAIDVKKILGLLDEKHRIILDMIYLKGFSHRDLAKELDMPLGTVKSRLKKAIEILRGELKKEKTLFINGIFITFIILLSAL